MFSALHVVYILCELLGVLCIFTPVIQIEEGRLRGIVGPLTGQYKYFGIPYAASERFQPPTPPPKWEGVYNAFNPIRTCAQIVPFLILGKEDCLYLDVYTPGSPTLETKIPVMVFFHGGAYYHGAKYHYDPEFLVTHNVIVVVINYRLGVLGFLCINGVSNLGFKDQVASLHWIKRNIKYFRGDEENVTIFGQSAGASSAGMHLLAPASRGLFHKAIMQSGTPLAPWAFNVDPLTPAFEDAKKLGAVSPDDTYKTFLKAPLYKLLLATKDVSINSKHFKYAPCVDGDIFLEPPYNTFKSGNFSQVPVILGTTSNEGVLFYGLNSKDTLQEFDRNFLDKLPSLFNWCSKEQKRIISEAFRSYYFGGKSINERSMKEIIKYYSDWISYSTNFDFSELLARSSQAPVYGYHFSYQGGRNYGSVAFGGNSSTDEATHSDELFYLFKLLGFPQILSTPDKIMITRMSTMWTNFAKTGNPTPRKSPLLPIVWSPITENNNKILNIDKKLKIMSPRNELSSQFFLKLLCEYGYRGYVPCEAKEKCKSNK